MFTILPKKGEIDAVDGFFCDGVSAGLKANEALDLGFIYSDCACDVSFVLTQNRFQAAPLKHLQSYPQDFQTNFILLNSKNANALTGDEGIQDIHAVFEGLDFDLLNPIMSSTGVIGQRLAVDKILKSARTFDLSSKNGNNLKHAIMTTDAYPKSCLYEVCLEDGSSFHIGAAAKGAGMINPNLATMLCFIVTDAAITKSDMQALLSKNCETSFNAISVDGDTSTNDTVMLLANKKSKAYDKEAFDEALSLVMHDMAMQIVSDGEGAKKMAAFRVTGAASQEDALKAAKALSNSLLVKTALFGEDPNFGRIASTIGASQITSDEKSLSIAYDDVFVYKNGENIFCAEVEKKAAKVLENSQFQITCDIGLGKYSYTAYGCDLGYDYVKINADYRT